MRRRLLRPGGRGGLWLLLAGAAGLLAALLTLRAAGAGERAGVLFARVALPAGTLVDERVAGEALARAPVPADLALEGLLDDPAQALGRRTSAPVGPGEPLTQAALGGAPGLGPGPLAPGERAVAVPLSAAAGAAAALRPGARVDVVSSTGDGLAGRTGVVVADAEVLAVVDPASSGLGEPAEALLRVSAPQALRVTSAVNFAREVRLLVRPAGEAPGGGPAP